MRRQWVGYSGALLYFLQEPYQDFYYNSQGYVSARLYKMNGGEKWKLNALLTAHFCPGIVFAVLFGMNLILQAEVSSAFIPFGTMVSREWK